MLTLNDMVKLKGRKVHLTTCDGKYEGIVKYISPGTQEVTLANALILPSQAPLYGAQHFYIFDITSCEVVSVSSTLPTKGPCFKDLKKKTKNAVASEAKTESFLKSAKAMTFYVDEVEFGETISDIEDGNDNDQSLISKEAEYKLSLPKEYEEILPKDFLLIGDIGVDFRDAIYHLKKQSMIGVAFEGNSIGRHGTLCWIGVSTKWCTFLFDISTLEEKAFANGLKAILEDCNILKVIHDCRQASDLLYHQYGTTLVNIFDTQIADVFINLQNSKSGKAQSHVKSLTSCLTHYLNLCDEDLYPYEMTHHSSKENFLWTNRPASNLMKDSIIKDVLFLRELRSIQMDLMLSSYINAVDIYLGVLRDASEEELELMPSQPSLLPQALIMNGLKVIDCKSCTGNIPSTEERFIQISKSSGFISAVQKNKEDATKMKLAKKQPVKELYIKGKQFHQEIKAVDDSEKKISQNQKQYTCPLQKSFSSVYTSKCSAQSLMNSEQPSFPECDSEHLKKLRYRNMQYPPSESHRHSSSHFTTHCQSQFSNKQNCFSSQKSCLPENVHHYSSDGLCSSSSKAIANPIECEHLKKGWSTTINDDAPDKHIVSNSHATKNEGILQGPSEYQVIEKNLKRNHVDSSVLVQNFRVEEKCVPCNSQETDDHERRCSSTTSFCSDVSENISNYDYLKIRLLPAGMLF